MKYKVGDRVRIKDDISGCDWAGELLDDMSEYCGCILTIKTVRDKDDFYEVIENGFVWDDDIIEGLADPKPKKPTMTEIFRLAIDTYGEDEQCRMIQEEMSELSVALSKFHREPYADRLENVQEEIADTCIMMQQAKMMFGEKEVDKIIHAKTERLYDRLKGEQVVEVVTGKHSINGKPYTWINPDNATVEVGSIAIAETSKGHMPIIVTNIRQERLKEVKHHKKIVVGGLSE